MAYGACLESRFPVFRGRGFESHLHRAGPNAPVAQRIEQLLAEQQVGGSIPLGRFYEKNGVN